MRLLSGFEDRRSPPMILSGTVIDRVVDVGVALRDGKKERISRMSERT